MKHATRNISNVRQSRSATGIISSFAPCAAAVSRNNNMPTRHDDTHDRRDETQIVEHHDSVFPFAVLRRTIGAGEMMRGFSFNSLESHHISITLVRDTHTHT
ncbi:unnamed protein product [Ectocarpus sp. 4 AP-2014]